MSPAALRGVGAQTSRRKQRNLAEDSADLERVAELCQFHLSVDQHVHTVGRVAPEKRMRPGLRRRAFMQGRRHGPARSAEASARRTRRVNRVTSTARHRLTGNSAAATANVIGDGCSAL